MDLNATLFGQMITFAIFVWFTVKFIWPMITKAMQERQENIANGLTDAENGRRLLERAKIEHQNTLQDAKAKASHIIEQANLRSMQLIEEAKEKARQDSKNILDNANADIEVAFNKAKKDLQSEVASLAVVGAEQILKHDIDQDRHKELLSNLVKELGNG